MLAEIEILRELLLAMSARKTLGLRSPAFPPPVDGCRGCGMEFLGVLTAEPRMRVRVRLR